MKNLFKLALCSLVLMSSTNIVWGQTATVRNCSTMDVLEQKMAADPSIELAMEEVERQTEEAIADGATAERNIITIPTVVHVIYKTNDQNISEAQIQSQMQVLNDDFRRMNSDANNVWSQAADTEIEFCLASVDPNGNPTTGITRKYSNTTSWGANDAMKYASQGGVDAWPRNSYLNMWVCNIGNGILGYAQFPGGSAATDGVVMSPQYFGTTGYVSAPFDGGRTTTHEVGHWLNLYHIWGDGNCNADDNVSDTPSSDAANYGCATGHVSCNSTDMVQNYMDYSDDACMNLFTAGQRARMRAVLTGNGFRASLQNSLGCGTSTATCDDGIQNQGEEGIDCGGPCAACETCNDGILNNGETSVDCGGPNCNACPTCNDGIQNQGEEGIDCGGPCNNACPEPTCDDGVQNGDETGVDCGGANCPECAADACAYYGSGPWDFIPAPTACGMNNAVNETEYQVWDNESYIFTFAPNTDYNFNFCNGYNPNVWEANITVWSLIANGTDLFFDTAISVAAGCSVDFTTTDSEYYLIIVNSEGSTCDGNITTTETDNGYAQLYCMSDNTGGGGCDVATGLEAVNFTATGVTLQWDAQADAQAYQLAGRRAGGNWKTFPQQTDNFRTFSQGIQAGVTYEWSVRVLCDGAWTEWALPPASFTASGARFGQATSTFDLFEDAAALTSNVYPNPATDKVTVSFTTANEGTAQIRVLDLAGRTILSAQHDASGLSNEVELSTTQLESGYYLVEVISGAERSVSKLNIIK